MCEALISGTRIFILGDPRREVHFANPLSSRSFLWWTGYDFSWEPVGGDTIKINDNYDVSEFNLRNYLGRIERWNYALQNVHESIVFQKASIVRTNKADGIQLYFDCAWLAVNRIGESICFAMTLLGDYGRKLGTFFYSFRES